MPTKKKLLETMVKLNQQITQRSWWGVRKEADKLTEMLVADCTEPPARTIIRTFSPGITRYCGNSGLSGGCTLAAAISASH